MDAKKRSEVPVKKNRPNGRKMFAHVETFLKKMQKSYSQCREMKKRKLVSAKNRRKKSSGHAKSSWEIIGAKGFAKKYKFLLWKWEKTTKLLIVFQFLLVSQLILWTHRTHLSQIYTRLVEVDLLLMPHLFSTKKRKNVAQGPKTLKSFKYFQIETFP